MRFGMLLLHIGIHPQICCCLETQPAPLLHQMAHLLSRSKTAPGFLFSVNVERDRGRGKVDPSNSYTNKTLKQIFSYLSTTNDQNFFTGKIRSEVVFILHRSLLQHRRISQIGVQCLLGTVTYDPN